MEGEDFKFVGDQSNFLAVFLQSHKDYLPGLEIVGPGSPLKNPYGGFGANKKHPRLSSLKLYPKGCLQPGCLIVAPAEKDGEDPIVLYRWAIASSVSNGGGAGGRPLWRPILGVIKEQLEKVENGEGVVAIDGDVSWGSTFRDLFTLVFKAPFTIAKYILKK